MEVKQDGIRAACKYCDELIVEIKDDHDWYRCRHGRFDIKRIPQYFAWTGIWKPNKVVAKAQENCPVFVQSSRIIFVGRRK